MFLLQLIGQRCGHDGVLEEAAGIADDCRVRQLALADTDHGFADIAEGGGMHVHGRQFFGNARVVQLQGAQARQFEFHCGDHIAVDVALEHAVSVGEGAGGAIQSHARAVRAVKRFHNLDEFADFGAIGADVLDRRCAYRAGDKGQVFQAHQALLQ